MKRQSLVVSGNIEFRAAVKAMFTSFDSRIESKLASDAKIAISRLVEDRFDFVVIDDNTVKNFIEEDCAKSGISPRKAFFLKVRTGSRDALRDRVSPFNYKEMLIESNDISAMKTKIAEALFSDNTSTRQNSDTKMSDESISHKADSPSLRRATDRLIKAAVSNNSSVDIADPTLFKRVNPEKFLPDILVIGSSTGGPEALEKFFLNITATFVVPVIIVQHMPAGFTKGLATRLSKVTGFDACEVESNQEIATGRIHIAPGDYHLKLRKANDKVICTLDQGPLINSVRPAVDPMFETAAKIFGPKVMSIVFTGMGEDGAAGAKIVKSIGGCVMIQNEASSVVWGMPGAVARMGIQDGEGTPEQIAGVISRQMIAKGAEKKDRAS